MAVLQSKIRVHIPVDGERPIERQTSRREKFSLSILSSVIRGKESKKEDEEEKGREVDSF